MKPSELPGRKVKVKVFIYSPKSRCKHAVHQTLHITFPGVGTHSYFQSHLPGKNAAHFLQLKPFVQFFFISFHQVPITAGWPEAVWIQSLPKAFTHILYTDSGLGNRTPDLSVCGTTPLPVRPHAPQMHVPEFSDF